MKQVQEVYQHSYYNVDRKGRPIYIERIGAANITELWKVTTEDRLMRHFIQEYERMIKLRFRACSLVKGEKI